MLNWFSKDIFELLLVSMNGLNNNASLVNSPAWTMSSMLIVEFIILSLLLNCEKLFYTLICPVALLVGFGFWRHSSSTNYSLWIGFTTYGTLRVFLAYCLALYAYKISCRLKTVNFNGKGRLLLTGMELGLFIVSVLFMFSDYNSRYIRWMTILMFVVILAIAMSGKSYTACIPARGLRITSYLGELSLGIYLSHHLPISIYRKIWPDGGELITHKVSFILITLILAVLFCLVLRWMQNKGKKLGSYIKTHILMES